MRHFCKKTISILLFVLLVTGVFAIQAAAELEGKKEIALLISKDLCTDTPADDGSTVCEYQATDKATGDLYAISFTYFPIDNMTSTGPASEVHYNLKQMLNPEFSNLTSGEAKALTAADYSVNGNNIKIILETETEYYTVSAFYTVSCDTAEGVTFSVPEGANANDIVVVAPQIADGYALSGFYYTDGTGEHDFTFINGEYSFIMPYSEVSIHATSAKYSGQYLDFTNGTYTLNDSEIAIGGQYYVKSAINVDSKAVANLEISSFRMSQTPGGLLITGGEMNHFGIFCNDGFSIKSVTFVYGYSETAGGYIGFGSTKYTADMTATAWSLEKCKMGKGTVVATTDARCVGLTETVVNTTELVFDKVAWWSDSQRGVLLQGIWVEFEEITWPEEYIAEQSTDSTSDFTFNGSIQNCFCGLKYTQKVGFECTEYTLEYMDTDGMLIVVVLRLPGKYVGTFPVGTYDIVNLDDGYGALRYRHATSGSFCAEYFNYWGNTYIITPLWGLAKGTVTFEITEDQKMQIKIDAVNSKGAKINVKLSEDVEPTTAAMSDFSVFNQTADGTSTIRCPEFDSLTMKSVSPDGTVDYYKELADLAASYLSENDIDGIASARISEFAALGLSDELTNGENAALISNKMAEIQSELNAARLKKAADANKTLTVCLICVSVVALASITALVVILAKKKKQYSPTCNEE